MTLVLSIFGLAFACLCIWLAVRIVNGRERWAKWMLAAVIALPVLYMASFGFAIRMYHHQPKHESYATIIKVYRPLLIVAGKSPSCVRSAVEQAVRLWLPSDYNFGIHTDSANFGIWPRKFE